MKSINFIFLFFIFFGFIFAEDDISAKSELFTGIPFYKVKNYGHSPKIDGKKDVVYKNALPLKFKFMHGYAGKPVNATMAWIICDAKNLFIFARCETPFPDKAIANKIQRDSGLWEDEVLEIFFDPTNKREPKKYFQIAVNAKGVFEDSRFGNKKWNPKIKVKTSIEKNKAWLVELQIPFSEIPLEIKRTTFSWAFNLTRSMRHHEDPDSYEDTAWSPTFGLSPHHPDKFGNIKFDLKSIEMINKDEKQLKVNHQHGQTFIAWHDKNIVKENIFKYNIYRFDKPITNKNISKATIEIRGLYLNSAKIFDELWSLKDLSKSSISKYSLNYGKPAFRENTVLGVVTIKKERHSFYAVLPVNEKGELLTKVLLGQNSMTTSLKENTGDIQPILRTKAIDSSPYCHFTDKAKLPLVLKLHPLRGDISGYGDIYDYFGKEKWGWRQGLPGVFSVKERRGFNGNFLNVESHSLAATPKGNLLTTWWYGYSCVPQWASHKKPKAYPFTERKLDWLLEWSIKKYKADRQRIYCTGSSMGGWGTVAYALRRPKVFAAVFPLLPQFRRGGCPKLEKLKDGEKTIIFDSNKTFSEMIDSVAWVSRRHNDLPFIGWSIGRNDGHGAWKDQIDMVNVLTKHKYGFAFAWNNGGHSEGRSPFSQIERYYPKEKFRLNLSFPAFGNSSLNDNLGNGDKTNGDLSGGINMGFFWDDPIETSTSWSIEISNELNKKSMAVDVTPRRCQKFKVKKNESYVWKTNDGKSGKIKSDEFGLITVKNVIIFANKKTKLTISIK